jgi:thiol:disulfide interchange protein
MSIIEIGVGVLVLFIIVGSVLFYSVAHQRESLESGKTPSLPPKREPPAETHAIVHLHPGDTALAEQLRAHANRAEQRGLRPFLEVGAIWCPPSKLFGEVLDHPRMQAALEGIYLIRVDMDEFDNDPKLTELGVVSIPVFFELDAEGEATGRKIDGGAWGVDTVENMSAVMARFWA